MKNRTVYALMVVAAVFWAGAFIAGKFSVPHIPVCTLTFLRFFFAVIVMTLIFSIGGMGRDENGKLFKLEKKHIPIFVFTGIGPFDLSGATTKLLSLKKIVLLGIAGVAVVIALGFSYLISCRIMEKKEF